MHNLLKCADVRVAMNAQAAGTTTVNGNLIDTFGYDGVAFIFVYGALTATQQTQAKLQGGNASNGSDAADLANSHTPLLLDTQGNTAQIIDVYRPTQRYIRPVVSRGTANAVISAVIAVLYHAEVAPAPSLDPTIAGPITFLTYPQPGTA